MTNGHSPTLGVHWTETPGNSTLTVAVGVGDEVTDVSLCVFNESQGTEQLVPLNQRLGAVAWDEIPPLPFGTLYGLRVRGGGSDPTKFLVDPYARALTGALDWGTPGSLSLGSTTDSVGRVPFGVVTDPRFDWADDAPPATPWDRTLIYEAHVKNVTQLHPEVPAHLRGTYAGVAHPAFVAHLQRLGVTAIELLPIHQRADEERLARLGLTNHWGYNTLGYFAPDQRFSSSGSRGEQVVEFKGMVKLLHQAGIEVILDVVYNHTAEGARGGAALSWRGFDPSGWYREPDVTGCGNTFDLRQPIALRMVLDSLRYWVEECHVDGFRFDLAPALCRTDGGFSPSSAFLAAVGADPVLRNVKLISEPWDIGMGGYQVGNFPAPWAEWNDSYRDTVREVWCREAGSLGGLAVRMTGSSDLFRHRHRPAWSSVNFVAAHDGMTTADLCTYERKHNESNGEDNRDGTDANHSTNCGVEGPTDSPEIQQLRLQLQRALLTTLLLSAGTPMLLAGDEVGHSQQGNNNAYCQDNEISWIDWATANQSLADFTAAVARLRLEHAVFHPRDWLDPTTATWWTPDGAPMEPRHWAEGNGLIMRLHPDPAHADEHDVAIAINNRSQSRQFELPDGAWNLCIDTATGWVRGSSGETPPEHADAPTRTMVRPGRSIAVFLAS